MYQPNPTIMTTNTTARPFDFIVKPTLKGTFQICYKASGNCYPTEYLTGIAAQNAINVKFGLPPINEPSQAPEATSDQTFSLSEDEAEALTGLLQMTIANKTLTPKQRIANKELYQSILAQL